jgi:hypothetical protein
MRTRTRNEPWPRPGNVRRVNGTLYRLIQIGFSDDDWGRKLSLEYVEEKPWLASQMVPRAAWWRRAVSRLRRNDAAPGSD